ncbi:hypothetical protein IAT38_000508 [Cryptococcus sp. DSM 104549]
MPPKPTATARTPRSPRAHPPPTASHPSPPPLPVPPRPLDDLMATLPREIHSRVFAYLLDADPITLMRVSRTLWTQVVPRLYSDIVFEARNCRQFFYGLGCPFGQGTGDDGEWEDSVAAALDLPGFWLKSGEERRARIFGKLLESVPRTSLARKLASFRYLRTLTIMDTPSNSAISEAIHRISNYPTALFDAAEGVLPTLIMQVPLTTAAFGSPGLARGEGRSAICRSAVYSRRKYVAYLPADLSGLDPPFITPDQHTPTLLPACRTEAYEWVLDQLARAEFEELCVDQV